MARQDAGNPDHVTLVAVRIRAVQQVQAGESPGVVIGALGFSKPLHPQLAGDGSGLGWDALTPGWRVRNMKRPKDYSPSK